MPEHCYKMFGAELKLARERAGVTQKDLGKMLGLTRVSVANIEAGRQRVLLHHCLALSAMFHIDLNALRPQLKQELVWT